MVIFLYCFFQGCRFFENFFFVNLLVLRCLGTYNIAILSFVFSKLQIFEKKILSQIVSLTLFGTFNIGILLFVIFKVVDFDNFFLVNSLDVRCLGTYKMVILLFFVCCSSTLRTRQLGARRSSRSMMIRNCKASIFSFMECNWIFCFRCICGNPFGYNYTIYR